MIYRYCDVQALIRARRINEIKTIVKGSDVCRYDSISRNRDSYVYMFMDPRDTINDYKLTEDCTLKHVIRYIGRGTGRRVINHDAVHSSNLTNSKLSRWITNLRAVRVEPLVIIYSSGLSKPQSEFLEADLIEINTRLQDEDLGLPEYRRFTRPPVSFNVRPETSHVGDCYTVTGERIQRAIRRIRTI